MIVSQVTNVQQVYQVKTNTKKTNSNSTRN